MRTIVCFLFALLVCAGLSAQKKTTSGEIMLEEGRKQWEEYCIDLRSHKIDKVLDLLAEAAVALKEENNEEGLCEACLLSAEAFSKNYENYDAAVFLCERVLEMKPETSSIYHFRATFLLASLYLDRNLGKSASITHKHFSIDGSSVDPKDVILGMSVQGKIAFMMDMFSLAYYAYDQIAQLDVTSMDRFTLVKYIEAMLGYSHLLLSENKLKEASLFLETIRGLLEKNHLENSSASVPFKNMVGQMLLQNGNPALTSQWAMQACSFAMEYIAPTSVDVIQSALLYAASSSRTGQGKEGCALLNTILGYAEQRMGKDHPMYYTVNMELARLYYREGDYFSSVKLFEECYEYASAHNYNKLTTISELVCGLAASGNTTKTERMCSQAIQILRDYVHNTLFLGSDESINTSWFTNGMRLVNSVANAIASFPDKDGILYTLALLSKNALLDNSEQIVDLYRRNGNKEFLQDLDTYQEFQHQIEDEYAKKVPDQVAIRKMKDKMLVLLSRMSNQYSSFHKEEIFWCDVAWEEISSSLSADEAAVEYLCFTEVGTGKKKYVATVLLRGRNPVNIPLEIDEDKLRECSPEALCKNGYLGSLFIKPIERQLRGKKTVYYSPAGVMNDLPLECVVEAYDMRRLSSTRVLLEGEKETKWTSAVFFGGLDYNLAPEEMEYYSEITRGRAPGISHNWSTLKGSLAEATKAYECFNSLQKELITGGEGVEERFKALSGKGVSLIHIATHGFFDIAAVERAANLSEEDLAMYSSGLVFAGANNHLPSSDGIDNGLLSSIEISRLNLIGCNLVVLSACGTGRIVSGRTSDVYGLIRAFKKAGCRSILVTLWDVDDQVTAFLMDAFYQNLSLGESPSEALASARETIRKSYPNPKYWAPFVLIDG